MPPYLDNLDSGLIHALGCPEDQADDVATAFHRAFQLPALAPLALNPSFLAIALGQCAVESGGFTRTREGLRYTTPSVLASTFKRIQVLPEAERAKYLRNPQGLANFVYANLYGNGDVASGDGYRYSGRGYIQVTFKSNYQAVSNLVGVDFVSHPELMEQPEGAASSAIGYLLMRKVLPLCSDVDRTTVDRVTKLVNTAMLKADERFQFAQLAYAHLTQE